MMAFIHLEYLSKLPFAFIWKCSPLTIELGQAPDWSPSLCMFSRRMSAHMHKQIHWIHPSILKQLASLLGKIFRRMLQFPQKPLMRQKIYIIELKALISLFYNDRFIILDLTNFIESIIIRPQSQGNYDIFIRAFLFLFGGLLLTIHYILYTTHLFKFKLYCGK